MDGSGLGKALREFTLGELLRWDLLVGIAAGGLATWRAIVGPARLMEALPYAVGLTGVVIGAVIAGSALMVASMDQAFLRKLRLIGKDPVRYIAPFMFTAGIATTAALVLVALAAVPLTAHAAVTSTLSAVGFGAAAWAIASLLANLDTLIQFLGLLSDAAEVDDETVANLRRSSEAASR